MNKKYKEPLFHMVKRDTISQKEAWRIRIIAFILSLVVGGLMILTLGHNPFKVYQAMVVGAWGSKTVIYETIKIATPLLITAIGISFAFKMRFWNIGGEGQILVGAVAAGYFGLYTAHIFPKVPLVFLMLVSGMLAGGLYAVLPAICKAKWGTNETLFTLMLNYIALAFVKYLMNGPWKAKGSSYPKIGMLAKGARLHKVLGVHWGWILALVIVVISYIYFSKTKHGYEISVVGESNDTARYAGISVKKVFIRTMFISGALCGLVGMLQFAGADYTITEGTAGGIGFTAITVAWLAKMNPYAMLVVSVFIAMLERGANTIQTNFKIPASAADLLIGIILFFMLGCEFFTTYRLIFREKEEQHASYIK
ncbi:MAG TPA: ABC transporter permease [Candidatus Merdenecus merdavium]|nr:ABC transporter permease [Candidatus Merdenecus merdavium]